MENTKEMITFLDEIRDWQARDNGIVFGGVLLKVSPDGQNYITTTRGIDRYTDYLVETNRERSHDDGEYQFFMLMINELFQRVYDNTHDLEDVDVKRLKKIAKNREKIRFLVMKMINKVVDMK